MNYLFYLYNAIVVKIVFMKKKSTYLKVGVNVRDLVPSEAFHPGELFYDELKERGITQKSFASMSGILPSQLNEFIKGKRGLSAEMALKFGHVLDMDPVYWLNLQMIYELDLAKIKQSKLNKRLNKLRKAS